MLEKNLAETRNGISRRISVDIEFPNGIVVKIIERILKICGWFPEGTFSKERLQKSGKHLNVL